MDESEPKEGQVLNQELIRQQINALEIPDLSFPDTTAPVYRPERNPLILATKGLKSIFTNREIRSRVIGVGSGIGYNIILHTANPNYYNFGYTYFIIGATVFTGFVGYIASNEFGKKIDGN